MKTIGLLLGCFIWTSVGFVSNKTKVKITNQSEVIIKGKSNVNSFECAYNSNFIAEEIHVVMTKKSTKIFLEDAKIAIKSAGFDCAHKMITKDFKNLLKAEAHPHIQLEVKELTKHDDQVVAKVSVRIAYVVKEYELPIIFNAITNNVKGQLKINIKDFNLQAPKKLLGMVIVDDHVEIKFNLFLQY